MSADNNRTDVASPLGQVECGCRVRLVVSAVKPRAEIVRCPLHFKAQELFNALVRLVGAVYEMDGVPAAEFEALLDSIDVRWRNG